MYIAACQQASGRQASCCVYIAGMEEIYVAACKRIHSRHENIYIHSRYENIDIAACTQASGRQASCYTYVSLGTKPEQPHTLLYAAVSCHATRMLYIRVAWQEHTCGLARNSSVCDTYAIHTCRLATAYGLARNSSKRQRAWLLPASGHAAIHTCAVAIYVCQLTQKAVK